MPRLECAECGTPMPTVRKPANWRQALWGGWTCARCGSEHDRWGRKLGETARASDPGGLTLSVAKVRWLAPELFHPLNRLRMAVRLEFPMLTYLREHLQNGDSRAAVVVSLRPLLVAAYTDELDCIVPVEYPGELIDEYGLREGTRLLTINTYKRLNADDPDLIPGPNAGVSWTGFHPIIAEFVSDDRERIKRRKAEIPEAEWARAYQMGKAYLKRRPGVWRDGRPGHSGMPAE